MGNDLSFSSYNQLHFLLHYHICVCDRTQESNLSKVQKSETTRANTTILINATLLIKHYIN